MPSGVKTWLYVYAFDGKRRKMNLGQYPAISLEDARSRFEDARRQVKNWSRSAGSSRTGQSRAD